MAEVAERHSLILSSAEIEALTGYRLASCQLEELRRQGFHRARRNPAGHVVLERAHYQAVCAGQDGAQPPADQPMLKSQRRRQTA